MLFIDGKWVEAASGRTFNAVNPATGEVLGQVADGRSEDTRAAIDAAAAAFPDWSARTAYARAALLAEAHRLMLERQDELAQVMTKEQGKPLRMARNEVGYAADFLAWFAEEAKRVYGETIPSARADQRFIVLHQAVGVAAAITPWNYPISMITRKVAPALAAGCTIVVKPAEQTPLCAVETFRVFEDAGFPPGVVNLITASDPQPVGDELLTNRAVRKISFTGSTDVGKHIAARAAEQMKRVSLELGGHAPFIVYDDADPEHAAKGLALVKFLNTGQACICPNRIFVQRGVADSFIDTLVERVGRLRPGNGLDDGVTIGPLIDEPALAKMQRQVDDARSLGATVRAGGDRLAGEAFDNGQFWAPTVLTDVTPDMVIYREETFGPIAPVVVFDDEDEVVAMANDTTYGLAATAWTQNVGRAHRMLKRLQAGSVQVNCQLVFDHDVPFGGHKQSGWGHEFGKEGIDMYMKTKSAWIQL